MRTISSLLSGVLTANLTWQTWDGNIHLHVSHTEVMEALSEVKSLHQAGGGVGLRCWQGGHTGHADHLGEQVPQDLLQARLGVVVSGLGTFYYTLTISYNSLFFG